MNVFSFQRAAYIKREAANYEAISAKSLSRLYQHQLSPYEVAEYIKKAKIKVISGRRADMRISGADAGHLAEYIAFSVEKARHSAVDKMNEKIDKANEAVYKRESHRLNGILRTAEIEATKEAAITELAFKGGR